MVWILARRKIARNTVSAGQLSRRDLCCAPYPTVLFGGKLRREIRARAAPPPRSWQNCGMPENDALFLENSLYEARRRTGSYGQ